MLIELGVQLAPLTTIKLGGAARRFAEATTEDDLLAALRDADRCGEPTLVLGGGSNVIVPDEGWPGMVVHPAMRGLRVTSKGDRFTVCVAAGEPWEEVVRRAVAEGWQGLECLSGIPGSAGATPIQNVGAYGREVGESLVSVRAWDRQQQAFVCLTRDDCRLSYRHSIFKQIPERWIITELELELTRSPLSAPLKYAELARALGLEEGGTAPLQQVADTVIALRRSKGMVADPTDPESISAGSYFTNPVLQAEAWESLQQVARKVLGPDITIPAWPGANQTCKVSAAWLIERSGFTKGYQRGGVGISHKHALALVNRGGTTRELLELEREIVDRVREQFGVQLCREPILTKP